MCDADMLDLNQGFGNGGMGDAREGRDSRTCFVFSPRRERSAATVLESLAMMRYNQLHARVSPPAWTSEAKKTDWPKSRRVMLTSR